MERRDQSMTANVPPAPIEPLSVPVRQVAPRLRGHTELPSAWSDLKCGDYVEIHRDGTHVGRGEIDDKTDDSSIIWVLFHDGRGRSLCHVEDGFSAVVVGPYASANHGETNGFS
ncbi:hypothetical protein AHiyo6_17900 [Arthrobacter sp. Hiyo6]|nr:hypothetical protein AHiyo6_17900 [Arthrobacter sp. Hiyo6]